MEGLWNDFWFVFVLFVLIVLAGGIRFGRRAGRDDDPKE